MPKRAMAVLVLLAAPAALRAQEPYRPLPRLSDSEMERRGGLAAEAAPAEPVAPRLEQREAAPPAPPVDQAGPDARQPATPPTADTFREGLSPYGSWVQYRDMGWVWRPKVAPGWRPYYRGQWIWTDSGWTWTSDEPWGWATYHYGRWGYDGQLGWFWVPGYVWGPAWVSWRYGPGVIGWAPLWPDWFFGFGLSFTFVPSHRFHAFPVHRFGFGPGFRHGHFPRAFPAPVRFGPRVGAIGGGFRGGGFRGGHLSGGFRGGHR